MVLTRSFDELVQKRAANDFAFAEAVLGEGVNALLAGEVDVGTSLLRDYITATVGFERLGEATGAEAESLVRLFGSGGSLQARSLFRVIGYLQRQAGVALHVTVGPGYEPA